ncbi:30S ribosomal protein S13 [Candidatus Woesearchaeota archaeon]|nr:30S ribosomal protein S13 [Candidatus Woesearchaeota archaeon]
MSESKDFKHLIRIANTDIDGKKNVGIALKKVKGVSFSFANAICKLVGIAPNKKTGTLTDSEIKALDEAVQNPQKAGMPNWMYNRQKDYETGVDMHVSSTNLMMAKEEDLKRIKKIKSFRGFRHTWGLPLRGQRTKSNFRKNKGKGSLGVKRKK